MGSNSRIGVMYDRALPPQGLAEFARAAESAGADELWVVEDLGYAGGISAATAALAATSRIMVGIGVAPAPLRNPALLAMEFATVAQMFPRRLIAGLGHGVTEWMAQVGAAPSSPLALLEEAVTVVRTLLRGAVATLHGREVRLDGVQLVHSPEHVPDVVTGVVRPRSLELSGRVADGTVLAEGNGPADVESALALIAAGRKAAADPGRPHSLTVFTHLLADGHGAGRSALDHALAEQAAWLGRAPAQLFSASGPQGTATQAAARIRELWAAGTDSVVLRPVGRDPISQLAATFAQLR
jgi:alkanesulfonate monooxygenase SsuD/methylene tetrahydromethanopterin reductase-like flavin-dependent oxidoreductase (luciferase family)